MKERSPLKDAIKKVVVGIGGAGAASRAKAVAQSVGLASAHPTPSITPVDGSSWKPSQGGEPWSLLQTPHGSVKVVPARGELERGSGRYPAPPPAPRVPRGKAVLPMDRLGHYPKWNAPEHPMGWVFPEYLNNPACRWLQVLRDVYHTPFAFPSSLSPEAGLLVHSMVRNIRPRLVIETGTFVGVSTMWIAAALQENGDGGVVHTFDDYGPIGASPPWRTVEMKSGRLEHVGGTIARAGLSDHVVFHPGNSSFEIRAAHAEFAGLGGAEMAFLDADHGVVGVWQDFWATEPVLKTGGFVLFHDTFPDRCSYDGPRHLLDHVNEQAAGLYEKLDMYLGPINYGLGVLRRVG